MNTESSNKIPQNDDEECVERFAENLCKDLNDNTSLNIRYFNTMCSGKTLKGKKCRCASKVDVACDSAESNPPKIYCHNHSNSSNNYGGYKPKYNVVIKEDYKDGDKTIHTVAKISKDTPELDDSDKVTYQVLDYSFDSFDSMYAKSIKKPGDILNRWDKLVWIREDLLVKIFYVRESGIIRTSQVSSATHSEAQLKRYRDVVESELVQKEKGDCQICFESDVNLWNLGCNDMHNFCQECIANFSIRKAACPVCRHDIVSLGKVAESESVLTKIQLQSPDYEIVQIEQKPEFVDEQTSDNLPNNRYCFKLEIKSQQFGYKPLLFSKNQKKEYLMLYTLFKNMVVFEEDNYVHTIYVRDKLFVWDTLDSRLNDEDNALLTSLEKFAITIGIDI